MSGLFGSFFGFGSRPSSSTAQPPAGGNAANATDIPIVTSAPSPPNPPNPPNPPTQPTQPASSTTAAPRRRRGGFSSSISMSNGPSAAPGDSAPPVLTAPGPQNPQPIAPTASTQGTSPGQPFLGGTQGPPPSSQPTQGGTLPVGIGNSGAKVQTGGGPQQGSRPGFVRSPSDQALIDTGIFNGIPDHELDRMLAEHRATQASPSPAYPHTLAELRQMVDTAVDDNNLLDLLRSRVNAARGSQSAIDRKNAMRRRLRPWIDSGIKYSGPKKEGLFLADGSRNPARVPRRVAGTRPSGPSAPGPPPPGPPAPGPPPPGPAPETTLPSTGSTGLGPVVNRPPGTGTAGPAVPGTVPGTTPGATLGSTPSRTGPTATVPAGTNSVTRGPGPGWRRRDDLFGLSADVLDSMGITPASEMGPFTRRLPRLPSTIDYNTQAWN